MLFFDRAMLAMGNASPFSFPLPAKFLGPNVSPQLN